MSKSKVRNNGRNENVGGSRKTDAVSVLKRIASTVKLPKGEKRAHEKTQPEATPAETSEVKTATDSEAKTAAETQPEKNSDKTLDTSDASGVVSSQTATPSSAPEAKEKIMQLQLKNLSKNGKTAFYSGAVQTVRLQTALFGGNAPQTIDLPEGTFQGPKERKPKMTAEERKAARANAPKPTLAEKIAKQQERLAKLQAAAAAEQGQGQGAGQPAQL